MKEKISRLAEGKFEYNTPVLCLEPENISLQVSSGAVCQGEFIIKNNKGTKMKGAVCCENQFLSFEDDTFFGVENKISFQVDATSFMAGEVIKGFILILTEWGSKMLPFTVTVIAPSCLVDGENLNDLYTFTQLAKKDIAKGIQLFCNPRFESVFLNGQTNEPALYRGFIKAPNKSLAMEEFLVSLHKKVPFLLEVNQNTFYYNSVSEQFMDSIVLTKNHWGVGNAKIQCDGDFIKLDQNIVRSHEFVGNTCLINFVIIPEFMREGKNYAKITISNVHQQITVTVMAQKALGQTNPEEHLAYHKCEFMMYQSFLQYAMKHLTRKKFLTTIEKCITTFEKPSQYEEHRKYLAALLHLYLSVEDGNEEKTSQRIAEWKKDGADMLANNPIVYCAYAYLAAKASKNKEEKGNYISSIKECYEKREHHWFILYLLLQNEKEPVAKKLGLIQEQLEEGCIQPVLYFCYCSLMEKNPNVLGRLTREARLCLHWACTENFISRELASRYAYLIGKEKTPSPVLLKDICSIYKMYPEEETLTTICRMLMKGRKIRHSHMEWYALAIEKDLKITDLYEYYLYAVDESKELILPEKVLLYFMYNNHLNANKRAFLYAYVIRRKEKDPETYESYLPQMEEFAYKLLRSGKISRNLAVLYEEFYNEDNLTEDIARALPDIMFRYEIDCSNPEMKGVLVRHNELEKEEYVPFVNGVAKVSMYSGKSQLFLVDEDGNRYVESVDYTISKLLHLDFLAQACYPFASEHTGLLLYLYEQADLQHLVDEDSVNLRRKVMKLEQLNGNFKRKLFTFLTHYYYEHFEGDLLDILLQQMDWKEVEPQERKTLLEYCYVRQCYDKAMDGLLVYGYQELDAKRLLKMASGRFATSMDTEDVNLVKLAWHIFKKGEFDENMLRYLCRYFTGDVVDMLKIWRTALGFDIIMPEFSERILGVMIFVDKIPEDGYAVFYQYVQGAPNKKVVRAFLKLTAYKYLVKGVNLPKEIFFYYEKQVRKEENIPCLVALLKYMSQKEKLTEEEKKFAQYELYDLYEQNFILPFFKDFDGKIQIPARLRNVQFIQYIANPKSEVRLKYQVVNNQGETPYRMVTMKNVYLGIHVKSMLLFEGEVLQYEISEFTSDGNVVKTNPVQIIRNDKRQPDHMDGWYEMINQMMEARKSGDTEKLLLLMKEYALKKEIVNKLMHLEP